METKFNQMYAAMLYVCEQLVQTRRELERAQWALGEIRAYLDGHGGDLEEIVEHYRTEGVPMPNAFDEEE